jgi:Uma2 family endonuclease
MKIINIENLPQYTIEDYKLWEGNWELIDGIAHAMSPAPTSKHQILNGKIFRELDEALDECPQCLAIIEAEWRINNNTVVIPDTCVICYEPDDYLTKAPSIIFEVISESSYRRDEKIKFEIYQQEGVAYYVLVYPDLLTAKIYQLDDGKYKKRGDYNDANYLFELGECTIDFNFNNLFKHFNQ